MDSLDLFKRFPNQKHIGEIFTPEEYVIRTINYLKFIFKPSKDITVIDPCAGLGQFEYYLQDYNVIANEIEQDNYEYIKNNIPVDTLNNVDSLQYNIPENIHAIVVNPPYSGHINNKKAKRSELWMQFIEKYFLNSNIPIGIFIVPCKWMSSQKLFTELLDYIYLVDVLDSKKFLLKESKWSSKEGVSARIMSGVAILILSKTKPDTFMFIKNNQQEILSKSIFNNINIFPVTNNFQTSTACKFIEKFIELTNNFGCITQRFLSQYHYSKNNTNNTIIPVENIYQSRRKRLLNKEIDNSKYHINTHFDDYKCIVSTSNECWNGYIHDFPATILKPQMIFTSNYIGFWGDENECSVFKKVFQSKIFNVLLCMIKQTQNFNSNYLWCTPLLTCDDDFNYFIDQFSEFNEFMNSFTHESRRQYDKSRFFDE